VRRSKLSPLRKRTARRVLPSAELRVRAAANNFTNAEFQAMNTTVHVTISVPEADARDLIERTAVSFFTTAEQHCSRFLSDNPLSKLNSHLGQTVPTTAELFHAITAAYDAYRETEGLFDPRVLTDLATLGYNRSFELMPATVTQHSERERAERAAWEPVFEQTSEEFRVNIGSAPIDLGGIVKGRTVDRVATALREVTQSGLINAGGDIHAWGVNPEGNPWLIGVEHPTDPNEREPIAVVSLTHGGLATSSIRKRHWVTNANRTVHHLIDPRDGQPASNGLASVTVAHPSTEQAEVLAKVLFIAGPERIVELAGRFGAEALWVHESGTLGATAGFSDNIVWTAS